MFGSRHAWGLVFALAHLPGTAFAQPSGPDLRDDARQALKHAATFFRAKVAVHGGYVYYVSLDLKERWGEGKVPAETIVVQPPGTPTVGLAYLRAHEATGDTSYLDAAREAAQALVQGQLESGGWTQVIHFAPPEQGRIGRYRKRPGGSWNTSSLDDDQTQSALRLLALVDKALGFQDRDIHEAARFGLDALLKAQFPNGGFPQVWRGPVGERPIVRARYPDHDWKTEGKIKEYWDEYTLNDGLAGTVASTLITAHEVYGEERFRQALQRLGDFLVLAQMPEPQPGWCQQYNARMEPIWARKFEPPAISGWESQDAMRTLVRIARYTGRLEYLAPLPKALAYFQKKCLLPDGRVARFYELHTNRPLYMDANYVLTYDDADVPTHYGWKQSARFDAIQKDYEEAREGVAPRSRPRRVSESEVRAILTALDDQGRWVSTQAGGRLVGQPKFAPGFRYLASDVFARNVETMSAYLAAGRE